MGVLTDFSYGLFAGSVKLEAANDGGSRHEEVLGSYLINQNVRSCRNLWVKAAKKEKQEVKARFVLGVAGDQSGCAGEARLDVEQGETNMLHLQITHVGNTESFRLCNGTLPCVESQDLSGATGPIVTVNMAGEAGQ